MENSKNKSHTNNKAQLDAIEKQIQVVGEEKKTFLKWAGDYIDATFGKKLDDLYEQKRVFTTNTATTSNKNKAVTNEINLTEDEAEIEQAAAVASTFSKRFLRRRSLSRSLSFLSNLRLKCKFCNRKMSTKVSFLLNVKLHVKL